MPRDKSASHARIIPAAKKEFLEKGFEKASMRSIASSAGLTSAGLYRHFKNKEEMFAALVEPILEENRRVFEEHKAYDYELLETDNLNTMWENGKELKVLLEQIYGHYDVYKLLICCSEGTRYSNYIHDFVLLEQQETLSYMEAAREKGIPVHDVRPEELHLLLSAYVGALFEVVVHDLKKEDAVHYIKTLQTFFTPGWRAVLGL
ncbi:MAG: TetR/AcrR family transcriptional regulator [Lachnospiraceae bacterium]